MSPSLIPDALSASNLYAPVADSLVAHAANDAVDEDELNAADSPDGAELGRTDSCTDLVGQGPRWSPNFWHVAGACRGKQFTRGCSAFAGRARI